MATCLYCKVTFSGDSQYCCSSCELLSKWLATGKAPVAVAQKISDKWEKYQIPALENSFNFSICPLYKKFQFYVEGLQCASCVHLLEDFPQYCHGVISSRLNYGSRLLEVETNTHFTLGQVGEAIEQMGYTPVPLKENQDFDQAIRQENKNDLKRLGVAGAIAGNLMLFSVPLYAGLVGALGTLFKWISFFAFLPLVFYCAVPFYKKAWSSLLARKIDVDMMIVVALWAGFVFSTRSLALGLDDIYFDSTASFIFLILVTRYGLKLHQNRLPQKNIFNDLFSNEIYEVLKEGETNELVHFEQIQAGQCLLLKSNQIIPCDGILLSEKCDFDLSFLTGEAYPQVKNFGSTILAGSRILTTNITFRCEVIPQKSRLAKALEQIDFNSRKKNSVQSLSDLVSHRLTLAVFSIAGLFFILTYQSLGVEAFKRCLALITIACPCAVAFGTPLAHGLGLKKAAQKGFFIKSDTLFEKLGHIHRIIFDKTGTLTSTELELVQTFPTVLSQENKEIILGLEQASLHPVALTIKKEWSNLPMKTFPFVKEVVGSGVEADFEGIYYKINKSNIIESSKNIMQVDFSIDNRRTAYLYFKEKIQPEVTDLVRAFQGKGFEVMMLTGDSRARALDVAKQVGIRPSCVFADQSAQSKEDFIRQKNPCLYIGDGLNDLQGLSAAYVSFAVRGTFESTLQVCDVYAPQKNLNALLEIFEISRKVHSTLKTNIFFAVFYNTVGGILALLGFINPLVAAVLMPVSSLIITFNTVGRLK